MRTACLVGLVLFILGGMANAQEQENRQPLLWKMSLRQDAEAWVCETACCTSEGLLIDVKTSDTAILLRRRLDASKFNTLEIDMEVQPAGLSKARLFWDHGRGFNRRASIEGELVNPSTVRYRLRLDVSPQWRGVVRGLRFHPADRPCQALVRSLKLYYRPPQATPAPREIQWVDLHDAPRMLKETERPVMIYIFRIGDARCRELAASTFKDQRFVRATHRFVCVRLLPVDLEDYREYLSNVYRTPTFVFGQRDPKSGKFVEVERLIGYHSLDQFLRYFALIEQKLRKNEAPHPGEPAAPGASYFQKGRSTS